MSDVPFLLAAAHFAAERHRDQRRKGEDRSPYVNHPLEVAHLLAHHGGIRDRHVLAAAILHDTVEDTDTSPAELEERFGPEVRALVEEVTDDKSLPKEIRKELQIEHAPRLSAGAKAIKLGDKISNVRAVATRPAIGWSLERRRDYLSWTARVIEGCRGVHRGLEAVYDAELADAVDALDPDAG